MDPGMPWAPKVLQPPPDPGPGPELFAMPEPEDVRELLEFEGLPAWVALGGGGGFIPKRLCLSEGGETLYLLDADAFVPAVFFGIPGFRLQELRRVLHGRVYRPDARPLLSLEFEEGFLPLRLSDASVLGGFLSVLRHRRGNL